MRGQPNMTRLELVREEKLYRLVPGRTRKSRLEASGVALVDDATALVVFDNLNQIARVDVSLKPSRRNRLSPAPSLGAGFEDIAADAKSGSTFGLVESVEDFDGVLRGYVAEYDPEGRLRHCARLPSDFQKANKGFEGLAHARHKGREHLYALREANFRSSGRIDVYVRAANGAWQPSGWIELPAEARFDDYSGLAIRFRQVAVVSQESARLWIGQLHPETHALIPGSGVVYKFPDKRYRNVEGIDWLSENTLVGVSDRRKKNQPAKCAATDQSIHVFRIPKREAAGQSSTVRTRRTS